MPRSHEVLTGVREIKTHLRVGVATLKRLVEEEEFPVYKLPRRDGSSLWISSKNLVDEWLRTRIQQAKTLASAD